MLDAGCGAGRNLPYFLARGFEIYAIDEDPGRGRRGAAAGGPLAPALPADNIRQGTLHALPWPDGRMDAVVCSAVLHFARDRAHFERMVDEMWRVLAPGGLFFARLASSIGIEPHVTDTVGRVRLPDGSDRFVVDEQLLLDTTHNLARHAARSDQDHERAEPAVHDDVGDSEEVNAYGGSRRSGESASISGIALDLRDPEVGRYSMPISTTPRRAAT